MNGHLKDKTMADKFMYIVRNNKWLKRLDIQLYVLTNQNSKEAPKVVELTN